MRLFRLTVLSVLFTSTFALAQESVKERAIRLAHEYIVVDGHVDIPYRLKNRYEDISERTKKGEFDYPRAWEGGLEAPFMSIYFHDHSIRYITLAHAERSAEIACLVFLPPPAYLVISFHACRLQMDSC